MPGTELRSRGCLPVDRVADQCGEVRSSMLAARWSMDRTEAT
jgi:hypothetical protein